MFNASVDVAKYPVYLVIQCRWLNPIHFNTSPYLKATDTKDKYVT